MQLQSKVIVKTSPMLLKKVQSSFDHDYELIEPESSLEVAKLPTLKYSLI